MGELRFRLIIIEFGLIIVMKVDIYHSPISNSCRLRVGAALRRLALIYRARWSYGVL